MSAEQRLGKIPAGLEGFMGIGKTSTEIKTESLKVEAKQVVEKQSIVINAVQDLEREYEHSTKRIRELELNLLEARIKDKNPQKETIKRSKSKSTQIGLSEGWTRATLIIREDHIGELKNMSAKYNTPIKDLVELAMTQFLNNMK